MKAKLFNSNMMEEIKEKIDWKEVVKRGVALLEKEGKATSELSDKIFESVNNFGAYFVLEKGIALLHAAPGPWCKEAATSFIFLPENIVFNNQEDKQAKLIITLSAPDGESHIGFIQEFGTFFMNDNFKQEALAAKTLLEFKKILEKYEVENEN